MERRRDGAVRQSVQSPVCGGCCEQRVARGVLAPLQARVALAHNAQLVHQHEGVRVVDLELLGVDWGCE